MLKRKLAMVYCLYFPCLTYLMKDEINSQVVFSQWLKKYSLTLCCIEVLLDSICNIDIDIDLRLKISNIT